MRSDPEAVQTFAAGFLAWRSRPALASFALALLLLSGWILCRHYRPPHPGYRVDILCTSCGEGYRAFVSGLAPFECAKCGERTAYLGMKCRKCDHVFPHVPTLADNAPQPGADPELPPEIPMTAPPKCPKCGSLDVGPVTPWEEVLKEAEGESP